MASTPALPADQIVTASDLVRHFGIWQDRAARAPLYILHRGRPRFVLTSIETMDALCAAHPPARPAAAVLDAIPVLDAIRDLVLLADGAGFILASSRAARAYFGALAHVGGCVDAIAPPEIRAHLAAAIRHVIDRGIGERLEIASAARAGRRLLLTIEPAGRGVAVIAQDTAGDPAADALDAASLAALDAAGGARALLDPNGRIEQPSRALCALLGIDPAALLHRPLASVMADPARPALDAALAQIALGQPAVALDSVALTASATAVPVRIGLAPIGRGGGLSGVAAVLLTQ